jgi:RHS repeat-associated protein
MVWRHDQPREEAVNLQVKRWLRVLLSVQLVAAQVAPAFAADGAGEAPPPAPPPPSESIEYYAYDAIGSMRVAFAPDGTVLARADFLPCGELLGAFGAMTEGFAGKPRDAETDLDYSLARMYRAQIGRFSTPDPATPGATANPQAWNRYSYALNNPLSNLDPDGLTPFYQTGPFEDSVTVTAPIQYIEISLIMLGAYGGYPGGGVGPGRPGPGGGGSRPNTPAPAPAPAADPEDPMDPGDQPKPPTQKQLDQENKALDEAKKKAEKLVRDKPDCANALGGLDAVLSGLRDTEFSFANLGPMIGDPATKAIVGGIGARTLHNPSRVEINRQGPFMQVQMNNVQNLTGFVTVDIGTGLTGTNFQALILLHEMGHVTGKFPADGGPDAPPGLNRAHTQTVRSKCF